MECIGDGNPEGTICLYHFEGEAKTANAKSAEWGRWVLLTGSLAAPESALLIYRVGFDQLGLREMYCRTEEENQPVVSFHASCGLVDRGIVNGPNGEVWREQVATVEEWPGIQARMQRHADMSRRLLSRS